MAGKMLGLGGALILLTAYAMDPAGSAMRRDGEVAFVTSDRCMSCHNGLQTSSGEDVSMGLSWRTGMMANAARDPYWQAAVRREITDHPGAREAIENECSRCHMPMANVETRARGQSAGIFLHLPAADAATPIDALAVDGVSCVLCHSITPEGLGTEESLTGGYVAGNGQAVYGPFEVDAGRQKIMQSVTGFRPEASGHLAASEFCAACHTLITHALAPDGSVIGELPEQVPFLEWKHSAYRDQAGCPSCHMPEVDEPTAISSVLGQPRPNVSRHSFRGGNAFMQRILGKYRDELGVHPLNADMTAAAARTEDHLKTEAASLRILETAIEDGRLETVLAVENRAGHKLPTAYPSRRVWIALDVTDGGGVLVYTSGAPLPDGAIAGNDHDEVPGRFEPHHGVITSADQVQIYEAILGAPDGSVTTGLLTASQYLKDNRLLPEGFEKAAAEERIAVHGAARSDTDFAEAGDQVRYSIAIAGAEGPFTVKATLWYQSIGYRWAQNLADYEAMEPQRFVRMYSATAPASATRLASAVVVVDD